MMTTINTQLDEAIAADPIYREAQRRLAALTVREALGGKIKDVCPAGATEDARAAFDARQENTCQRDEARKSVKELLNPTAVSTRRTHIVATHA